MQATALGLGGVVRELAAYIRPWKGRLTLTFFFGVTRVLAFIGVGLLSALAVPLEESGGDTATVRKSLDRFDANIRSLASLIRQLSEGVRLTVTSAVGEIRGAVADAKDALSNLQVAAAPAAPGSLQARCGWPSPWLGRRLGPATGSTGWRRRSAARRRPRTPAPAGVGESER